MEKLAAYRRVSSHNASQQEPSEAEQVKAIRAWSKTTGKQVVVSPRFRDMATNGDLMLEDREGLSALLEAIRSGEFTGLAVSRLDRLSRTLTAQEAILAAVWQAGGTVYAADAGEVPQDDPDDPMRTAMRQMMGVFVQLDKGMTLAKLRRGKTAKRARGGYVGGYVPLGKAAVDGELVDDAEELATIRRLHELHAEGMSLREIAAVLASEGRKTKTGATWHPSTVARALARTP